MPVRLAFVLLMSALVSLVACDRDAMPQLIQVTEISPREAEVGDRIELKGTGYPQGKTAHLLFKGTLFRPGEKPITGAEVPAEGHVTGPQRVELVFTDALQALFCGSGDRASHTTFEGEVEIAFAAISRGAPPIAGTLHQVILDFRPSMARPLALEARAEEGDRALGFLGIQIAGESPGSGGLVIGRIEPQSRADLAAIHVGDVITRFGGVRIASKADAIPAAGARTVPMAIRRGNDEYVKEVVIDGFKAAPPIELLGAAIVLALAVAIVLLFLSPTPRLLTWVERRVAARMLDAGFGAQPGTRGSRPHWFASAMNKLFRHDLEANPLVRFAPHAVFVFASTVFAVLPFAQFLVAADLDVGVLFVIAVTALVSIGLVTGGFGGPGKYSLLGGIRAAGQVLLCQAPAAASVICIVMMTGSLRVHEIIRAQGGAPWDWFLFRSPVTFALVFLYFAAAIAEGRSSSKELAEAEGGIADLRGRTARSATSPRQVFFFFAEWAHLFVMCGVGAALFLGGWQLPGLSPAQQDADMALKLLGSGLFLVKAWLLIGAVAWTRWLLPRVRIQQMTTLSWKYFAPLSIAALACTAAWVSWAPGRAAQQMVSAAMLALFLLLSVYFAQRVRYNLRSKHAQLHLNPFL